MEQKTSEWFAARNGKVTASRVADVVAKTKSGYSTSRDNYMAQLVCERMTGTQAESFNSSAMQWGTDTEPFARAAYETAMDVLVSETGFIIHPTIAEAGASPDGLVGDDGLIEIKCPNTATHIETLLSERVPAKYITQMMWQMTCTGRKWCDFVSFDPRMPEGLQIFIKRVEFHDSIVKGLESEVKEFLTELETKIVKLNERKNGKVA